MTARSLWKDSKRLDIDGAKEEKTPDIKDFLMRQGPAQNQTAQSSFQSNAMVERRFDLVFATAKESLLAASAPLNNSSYRSMACLDGIKKANFLPFVRYGRLQTDTVTAYVYAASEM